MAEMYVEGEGFISTLVCNTITIGTASITDANVVAGTGIAASKLEHRVHAKYVVADGTTVAATSGDGVPIYVCTKTGGATIKSVSVICPDAPSGGDLTFTVDVKYANDTPTAATTILTGVVTYPNATSDYTVKTGTLAVTALASGDMLLAVVAVSGSTGTQGQGLLVQVEIDEEPA